MRESGEKGKKMTINKHGIPRNIGKRKDWERNTKESA